MLSTRGSLRYVFFLTAPWLLAHVPAAMAGTTVEQVRDSPDGFGGAGYAFQDVDLLTDEQRRTIWTAIRKNVHALEADGKLPRATEAHPLLGWPLRLAAGGTDPGYHTVLNFVDQDPSYPNHLRDYNCGSRTYDTSAGYNHQGIDFITWPFGWKKMDNNEVEIVAAAPGTIVYKSDGNFDRSCSFNNNQWNSVVVRHADNSMAWYGHMKSGSPTSKPVGATVIQGEYLGVVGSSGNSTGPHLHFEVYDSTGVLNEPYQGPCNLMNADSWWQSQRPYYDSGVNHVATNFFPPSFPTCPNTESPNEATSFTSGTTIYFVAYFRDQLRGQTSQYRVLRPDLSVYSSWSHEVGGNYYAASYWYWYFENFSPSGPAGTWRFEVTFEGQSHTHFFTLDVPPAAGRVPDNDGPDSALRVSRAGGDDITLTWSASCLASDNDYAVYEGELGAYYSHDQRLCSTGGATTVTFTTYSDYLYYLVVPTNGVREGSYGTDSAGAERPPGYNPCQMQLTSSCP